VDNILSMRFIDHETELKRLLSILKIRDSEYDPSLVEVIIKDQGLGLRKGFKRAEHALSGSASTASKP
jgi:circadian clock protein KaiC